MMGLEARRDQQTFQGGDPWTHQSLLFQMLASHLEQESGFVMLQCALEEPVLQGVLIIRLPSSKSKIREDILHRVLTRFCPVAIGSNACGRHMELGR